MIIETKGDATAPDRGREDKRKLIVHVCNDWGGWGAGFVLALSARNKRPEHAYREWFKRGSSWRGVPFRLGEIDEVIFNSYNVRVVNMIAQTTISDDGIPLSYAALLSCLQKVDRLAAWFDATIHAPRIGCGLAGGDWTQVRAIIEQAIDPARSFYVYTLPHVPTDMGEMDSLPGHPATYGD